MSKAKMDERFLKPDFRASFSRRVEIVRAVTRTILTLGTKIIHALSRFPLCNNFPLSPWSPYLTPVPHSHTLWAQSMHVLMAFLLGSCVLPFVLRDRVHNPLCSLSYFMIALGEGEMSQNDTCRHTRVHGTKESIAAGGRLPQELDQSPVDVLHIALQLCTSFLLLDIIF